MGVKIHNYGSGDWFFHCPGCGYDHPFRVNGDASRPQWQWNGSVDRPTFTPSLIVNRGMPNQCHLIVTDGIIQFCADCHHSLAGQKVEIPDWEENTVTKFDFGTPSKSSVAPHASPQAPETKNCPKCGRPMATGGTSRWVCLYDGTAAA